MKPVRTRFAPSPTGFLHVGGVRTALFAWLLARQTGGQFILRLEDTDKSREVTGSDQHIMDSLTWLGLKWDEGIGNVGGPYGPYKQSERLKIYHDWAHQLIERGRAYVDPYTPQELNAFRDQAKATKKPFLYRDFRPTKQPLWDERLPLRFKSEPTTYHWNDAVMGEMHAGKEAIDDFIIIKSDGYPTYNFAHIIDDMLMKCTHVIRSQEFLSSVPKYLNLYDALAIERPVLATVPFVMAANGQKKLSKRDGAKDVLDYAREGFLPDTMLNFMATLGWNDGTTQELFSLSELINKFSLNHVQRSGARFDEQRLIWMNGAHIRRLAVNDLFRLVTEFWPKSAKNYDDVYKSRVLSLVQERLKYFQELPQLTTFFFEDLPINKILIGQNKLLSRLSNESLIQLLEQTHANLAESDFSDQDLTKHLNQLLEQTEQKPAILFSLIRIATTQVSASPSLAETMAVLGRDRSLHRIEQMINVLKG